MPAFPRTPLLAIIALSAVLALLFAGRATGCRPTSAPDAIQLTVERRPDNALIGDATVQLARPASTYLEYGNDQIGWLRTPTLAAAPSHRLALLRMLPETTYEVRAFSLEQAGACPASAASTSFTTGSLPAGLRPTVLETSGQPSFELMLMEINSLAAEARDRTNMLTAVDAAGRVVWYYTIPAEPDVHTAAWTAFAVKERANGNLVFHAGGYYGFEEITMDGRRVRYVPARKGTLVRTTHHDFLELPDGRLLFLARQERTVPGPDGGAPRLVRGDTLNVLDLDTGAAEQVWSVFDMLDPNQRTKHWREVTEEGAEDWTHANTVSLGLRGNILLSLRSMDQVISLSPDLKTLEWRLGGPGGQFTFPDPLDRFWGQHTVHEVAPNRILMFDNGAFRPEGEYSRALELELDFATMTARKVWEYRHSPDYFASRISSATRLPNGNTLLNFGFWDNERQGYGPTHYGLRAKESARPVLAVEARPDGSVAWQNWLEWDLKRTRRYRTYPRASLAGEFRTDPTPFAGAGPLDRLRFAAWGSNAAR